METKRERILQFALQAACSMLAQKLNRGLTPRDVFNVVIAETCQMLEEEDNIAQTKKMLEKCLLGERK